MRFIHHEREYVRIEIHPTLNGYTIFARNMHTDNMVPITIATASMLDAVLPEDYHPHHSSLKSAQKDIQRLAEANNWPELSE